MIFSAMEVIKEIKVKAPIKKGQVIKKDFMGINIDLIASRSIKRRNRFNEL